MPSKRTDSLLEVSDETRVFMLLFAFATACGSSTGPTSVEGLYDLQTINGAPLPYTLPGSVPSSIQVLSDQITLARGRENPAVFLLLPTLVSYARKISR
jgi:hypothetical protein